MDAQTPASREVLSVSEIVRQVQGALEAGFPALWVEGELSNFRVYSSGHWYFTLKDDKAQLSCVMFRGRNLAVRFKPADGAQVRLHGKLGLYEARGDFQLVADQMEEAGDGALRRAFEELKARLQAEGLFAEERKRPLPVLPRHLAIITSPSGAAIHDVLTVLRRRFPALRATLIPAQVQGDGSAPQLVRALELANSYADDPFDLILLTRGGGSLEDLWSFNTEPVARAVAASRLPVVCAVGHESDVSIAELVADLRAATPSAAAELIAPDGAAWLADFKALEASLIAQMTRLLEASKREALHLRKRLRHPERRLQDLQQRTDDLHRRLVALVQQGLRGYRFDELRERLEASMHRHLDRQRTRLGGMRLVSPLQRLEAQQAQLGALRDKLRLAEVAQRTGKAARLALAGEKLNALSPLATVEAQRAQLSILRDRLVRAEDAQRTGKKARLELADEKLNALSPRATLERGFAIVTDKDGQVLTTASAVAAGDEVRAELQRGTIAATVHRVEDA